MDIRTLAKLVNLGFRRRKPQPRRGGRKKAIWYWPRLESLEDRTMLDAVHWMGGSGNWSDPSHWTTHVPGAGDTALIDATGTAYTVTLDVSPTVAGLTLSASNATLLATGQTLTVNGPASLMGTLMGGTVAIAAGSKLTAQNPAVLDGVTVNGTLALPSLAGNVTVRDGLTLNGTATIDALARLLFNGSQTLGGTGSLVFISNSANGALAASSSATTITLGPGINVHGGNGYLGYNGETGTMADVVVAIQGSVQADTSGRTIILGGTVQGGTYHNSNGGKISLVGTLMGGVIASDGILTAQNPGVLDGVTMNGSLALPSLAGNVTVRNGLTLNGTVTVDALARLLFSGSQTVSGSGSIVFTSVNANGAVAASSSATTITLGPGITVHGGNGYLGYNGETGTMADVVVAIQGSVQADTSGRTIILGGTIQGGSYHNSNGGKISLMATLLGGTVAPDGTLTAQSPAVLDGLTVNGTLALPSLAGNVTVRDGLTLNGTATVNALARLLFSGSQSLSGTGSVLFTSQNANGALAASTSGTTITIGPGITIHGQNGYLGYNGESGTQADVMIVNQGTVRADIAGTTLIVGGGALANTGILEADNQAKLTINAPLSINDPGMLIEQPTGTIIVGSDLLGNTRDRDLFAPSGTTILDGGTTAAPRLLEAMSQDVGNQGSGLIHSFAFHNLSLGGPLGAAGHIKLVNNFSNSGSAAPEAVYVDSLVVPAGASLDLNGFHVFARSVQIQGTVLNGTVSVLVAAGPLALGVPASGTINSAGQIDDWTLFDRAGQSVALIVNTGASGSLMPSAPTVQFAQIRLLDPTGHVLVNLSNSVAGTDIMQLAIPLSIDGVYHVQVQPQSGSTIPGNYILTVADASIFTAPANVNQTIFRQLNTPYELDHWTFAGAVNQQIQFNLINVSNASLRFDLNAPDGSTVFTGLTASSNLLTLTQSGTYTLTVRAAGGQNGAYAFQIDQTSLTDLTLGTPFPGTFAGSAQAQLFRAILGGGQQTGVNLTDPSSADHTELYARFGSPPTRMMYDYADNGPGPNHGIVIPNGAPGTWYFLVYAESTVAGHSFTMLAASAPLVVGSITPDHYAAGAAATLTVTGAGFDHTVSASLVGNGSTTYEATNVLAATYTQLSATFNLAGVPAGSYGLRVLRADGAASTMPNAFSVLATGNPNFQTHLVLPAKLGRHQAATLYVTYTNTGNAAMRAPLLILDNINGQLPLLTMNQALLVNGLWTSALPTGYSHTATILASGKTPGMLQPGESVTMPVYYAGLQQPWDFSKTTIPFELRSITSSDMDTVNWSAMEAALQPPSLSAAVWHPIFQNIIAHVGTTWGGYAQMLDNEASYFATIGEDVTDIGALWGFAVQQADGLSPVGPNLASAVDDALPTPGAISLSFGRSFGETIASRNTFGSLGYGWSTPWQISLTTLGDGTVVLMGQGATQRRFQPDSRTKGKYFSGAGDTSILTKASDGTFTLTEANGTITHFRTDGKLDYIQDTNGNRITAAHNGAGQLISLTPSSGQSFSFTYNSAGLLGSMMDSFGRQVTYTYDGSNQHLLSVATPQGTTQYTYITGVSVVTNHALASITFPDGTHEFFTYNTEGHLATTSRDGGADTIGYTYNLGQVTSTDALNNSRSTFFNDLGFVAKTQDALGNITSYVYNPSTLLVSQITDPLGQTQSFTYDAKSNLLSSTNQLGNTTSYTYGPDRRVTSLTDANGNRTTYQYDASGNLLSTTYPDGSVEASTFNLLGEPISFLNRNGQPIAYAYNVNGQLTHETFPDASSFSYTYDSHGNMITATDASGMTMFTYNAADELTNVTYPDGALLQFGLDAAGRRIQMVQAVGASRSTVNYHYDTAGRLSGLTDGTGNSIVAYTYNGAGQLVRKDNGNATYTTYVYDAIGNVLHLVNLAPTNSVNSRFDYTYNSLGEVASMATLDGTWTYSYDRTAELIHAVFASLNPSISSQDLTYNYDAMGNRTSTIVNGVTTMYTTNNLNEYTSVGGVPYVYDRDGNLVSDGNNAYAYNVLNQLMSVTGPTGTISYTYNSMGQRTSSTMGNQVTKYLIDPTGIGSIVAEYSGNGTTIANDAYGLGLVSKVSTNGAYYYDYDALDSTVGLTNSSGSYINKYSYLPFGESLSSSTTVMNAFQFAGQLGVTAEASGLYTMRFRAYLPTIGRFLTVDPLKASGGDANVMRYVHNNPLSAVDPSGTNFIGSVVAAAFYAYVQLFGVGSLPEPAQEPVKQEAENIKEVVQQREEIEKAQEQARELGEETAADSEIPAEIDAADAAAEAGILGFGALAAFLAGFALGMWPSDIGPESPIPSGDDSCGNDVPSEQRDSNNIGGPDDTVPTPTPQGGENDDTGFCPIPQAQDPNSLVGPSGFGPNNFVVASRVLQYQINFENASFATAPAQGVTIADQLSNNLDWSTFRLIGIGWGDTVLMIPTGSDHFETTVATAENGMAFNVQVEVGIHTDTGVVFATLQSIDPDTELPPDVLTGFLPPEDGTGRGMGFISYIINVKAGVSTGTQIRDIALVTFDEGVAIATDQVNDEDPTQGTDPNKEALITIDAVAPTSSVAALPPTEPSPTFTISWSGTDDAGGSGIAVYDIYVSDNGGPFQLFLGSTTLTSAMFTGMAGHTYGFYSVATDNVGNRQNTPTAAQTTTMIAGAPLTVTPASNQTAVEGGSATVNLGSFSDTGTGSWTVIVAWGDGSSNSTFNPSATGSLGNQPHSYGEEGTFTVTITVTDTSTNQSGTAMLTVTVSDLNVTAMPASVNPTAGAPFGGAVATFSDPGGAEAIDGTHYSASITWGDNTPAVAGTITFAAGIFTVNAVHTYASAGSYTITATINHEGMMIPVQISIMVISLGQFVQAGLVKPISFWAGLQGQELVRRFTVTSSGQTLGQWLATTYPNLYGGNNGSPNLNPFTNAQISSYYLSLFLVSKGTGLDAEVLATTLEVFTTTLSLGSTTGQSNGFTVNSNGLGAYSWNVGISGQAFGVANNAVLDVYQILLAANNSAAGGEPWGSNTLFRNEAFAVFHGINGG